MGATAYQLRNTPEAYFLNILGLSWAQAKHAAYQLGNALSSISTWMGD